MPLIRGRDRSSLRACVPAQQGARAGRGEAGRGALGPVAASHARRNPRSISRAGLGPPRPQVRPPRARPREPVRSFNAITLTMLFASTHGPSERGGCGCAIKGLGQLGEADRGPRVQADRVVDRHERSWAQLLGSGADRLKRGSARASSRRHHGPLHHRSVADADHTPPVRRSIISTAISAFISAPPRSTNTATPSALQTRAIASRIVSGRRCQGRPPDCRRRKRRAPRRRPSGAPCRRARARPSASGRR